jgi:hypothetical protein
MVMLGTKYDKSVGVPKETMDSMRREVAFWYPTWIEPHHLWSFPCAHRPWSPTIVVR